MTKQSAGAKTQRRAALLLTGASRCTVRRPTTEPAHTLFTFLHTQQHDSISTIQRIHTVTVQVLRWLLVYTTNLVVYSRMVV
jgi:hypothetical protein